MPRRKPVPVVLPRKPAHVEVVWQDAAHQGKVIKLDKVAEEATLVERHTTGYLVYQDKKRVVIAQTFDPEQKEVDDVIAIPAPWVRRRKRK